MHLPKIGEVNKRTVIILLLVTISAVAGYLVITFLVNQATNKLDEFAVDRVNSRKLISEKKPEVIVKEIPVVTTLDIKGQVDQAIKENLGK